MLYLSKILGMKRVTAREGFLEERARSESLVHCHIIAVTNEVSSRLAICTTLRALSSVPAGRLPRIDTKQMAYIWYIQISINNTLVLVQN